MLSEQKRGMGEDCGDARHNFPHFSLLDSPVRCVYAACPEAFNQRRQVLKVGNPNQTVSK